jgi:hypothetical protein
VFCPNCGTQNDESNAKCQKCGFNIKGAVAPKFKGTMLMMNAPPGVAQRAPSPAAAPVPKPAPVPAPMAPAPVAAAPKKSLAKATMIGVAPPSPGAVTPPAQKPDPKTGTLVQGSTPPSRPSAPPSRGAAGIPRPAPAPSAAPAVRQASGAPVNPFGGTMLMGAVPEIPPAQPSPPAQNSMAGPTMVAASAPVPTEDKGSFATSPTNPAPPNYDQSSALSTTTPSVAPPAPAIAERLPSEMATVASAISPAIDQSPPRVPAPAAQDWGGLGGGSASDALQAVRTTQSSPPESLALAALPKKPPAVITWLLGIVTLGIYPLITWLVRGKKAKPNSASY